MAKRKRNRKHVKAIHPVPRPAWPEATRPNLLILAAITLILFRDVYLHPSYMLWASDIVRAHATYKSVQWNAIRSWGIFPLWDPTVFCGKSIVGDPLTALLNPLAWLFWLIPSPILFGYYLWFYVMLGAWGTYFWARVKGCAPIGGVVAATAFVFSGKTAAHIFAGHIEVVTGVLCLPWILWAVERILQRKNVASALLLGFMLALAAVMGSVQMLYWNVLVVIGYVGLEVCPHLYKKAWHDVFVPIGLTGLGGLTFLAAAAAWWFPIVRQTLLLAARTDGGGYGFATMGSAAPQDIIRFIWPFSGVGLPTPFVGDGQNDFFWESAGYPGLIALTLALFLLIVATRNRSTITFSIFTFVTLFAALGPHTPIHRIFYHLVPGFSLFRAPGRLLFYTNFFLAGMAGLGITELLRAKPERRWLFTGVVALSLLLVFVATVALQGHTLEPVAGKGSALLLILGLSFAGLAWSYNYASPRHVASAILGLMLFDCVLVWNHHIHVAKPREVFASNSVVGFLEELHLKEPFRYFDPTYTVPQQLAAKHGLESITGYHPGIYKHHLEMYKALWTRDESDIVQLHMHSPREIACASLLDVMNVKYVVAYEPELDGRFTRVFSTPEGEFSQPRHVYERKDPLPRAYVVGEAREAPAGQSVLETLCATDLRKACVVAEGPIHGGAAYQPLALLEHAPGRMLLEFETASSGVVVVSQSWHPDWYATDHGVRVKLRKVNHGQVGVPVGAGQHSLQIRYRPWDFYLGCLVSALTWIGLGLYGLKLAWDKTYGASAG